MLVEQKGRKKSLPIEDLRAVVIAASSVNITAPLLSRLLENDAAVVHCNRKFQPVGITTNLSRTIDPKLMEAQINPGKVLTKKLWRKILRAKAANQSSVLKELGSGSEFIDLILKREHADESHVSRVYWGLFFKSAGVSGYNRSDRTKGNVNALLNYGYAVVSSLIHRSIVVHGLLPQIGLHHKASYRGYPLVYDLMEPYRPIVDYFVLKFAEVVDIHDTDPEKTIKLWAKFFGLSFVNVKLNIDGYFVKMVNAVDRYVTSYVKAVLNRSDKELWLPSLGKKSWQFQATSLEQLDAEQL